MQVEHVQTKHEIEQRLASLGIRPRKRWGQHFLIDGNLMRRLVAAAELDPDDLVLEVGGGTGGLTDLLVGRARRVLCVEVDRDLLALLSDRFESVDNIVLVRGDILESKHRLRPDVAKAVHRYDGGSAGHVKLVANLPYQVATPLMMNLLIDYPEVRRLCFTVQAEVGDRITARPGCKDYGPLSIVSQLWCEIQTIARIPPQAFWPRPAVQSLMIRMDVRDRPLAKSVELAEFARLLRGVFDHRRKTLRAALGYVVDEPTRARIGSAFDATRRPESFSVDEWVQIFNLVRSAGQENP